MSTPPATWRTHYCPTCDAEPGDYCTSVVQPGRKCTGPHAARAELARESQVTAAGTVERAMKSRSDLECAWFSVVNCQE